MSSLLNIGVSGLNAQQAALNIVGQNITNASTPGYSRQQANIVTQTGSLGGGVFSGAGARVDSVTRIADDYINNQIRIDQSLSSELGAFTNNISQLERTVFDDGFGIDSALSDFFGALQNASSNPSDTATRQFVLSRGVALTERFGDISERLVQQARDINGNLDSAANGVNDLAEELAQVNLRIAGLQDTRDAGARNAMIDQRDILLKELSGWMSIQSSIQSDGQVNVFAGKGQSLVLGGQHAQLEVSENGTVALRQVGSNSAQDITNNISGGEIGGLLAYRSQVLEPMQTQIGHLAASVVSAFNSQHKLGIDLDGDFGGNFFREVNDPALVGERVVKLAGASGGSNVGKVNVYIEDPLANTPSNYDLNIAEDGSYSITRNTDNTVVYRGSGIGPGTSIEFDGLRVVFESGTFEPGDALSLRPYASLAGELQVDLKDPASLAFGSPVALEADTANSGSATIRVAEITDTEHPIFANDQSLVPPMLVRFLTENQYEILDNSDPTNPTRLQPDLGVQNYVQGIENHILPYEQGTTLVNTSGPQAGRLPASANVVSDLSAGANAYPSGPIQLNYALDNGSSSTIGVNLTADSTARGIATQLSNLPGVTASARTSVSISNLVDFGGGTPVALGVNGQLITGFDSIASLADQINATPSLVAEGITARSDGTTIELISSTGDDLNLHFQGDPAESLTLTDASGQSLELNGAGPANYRQATIGGEIAVILAPDARMETQLPGLFAANPEHKRADFGFDLVLSGNVSAGDRYAVSFNADAVGDNRNAQTLGELSDKSIMGDPLRTFGASFAGLIQDVGAASAQAKINRTAADSLLQQSESYRESISGVNLDEEAANLIRYEQAYNASAQVISAARDMFNVLLRSVS